jgi:putative hemolysin
MKTKFALLAWFTILLVVVACSSSKDTSQTGLANPAAVHCEEQGYTHEIRTDADGNQSGVCIFDDGSECDAWAFFRGECEPRSQVEPTPTPLATD